MNNNYDTDKFDAKYLQSQVVTIHICGNKNEGNKGDEDGNPPTNHWNVFLQLAEGGSIRLDMTPGYGSDGLRGMIALASKRYRYTLNSMKTLSFPVKVYATVQTIVQVINSRGRDRHRFTKEWEGCRFLDLPGYLGLEAAGNHNHRGGHRAICPGERRHTIGAIQVAAGPKLVKQRNIVLGLELLA